MAREGNSWTTWSAVDVLRNCRALDQPHTRPRFQRSLSCPALRITLQHPAATAPAQQRPNVGLLHSRFQQPCSRAVTERMGVQSLDAGLFTTPAHDLKWSASFDCGSPVGTECEKGRD